VAAPDHFVQFCAEQVTGDHLTRLHHRILHINPSIRTSINQYISKSSLVRNRVLVIISPGCTFGFCTSIHQSEHQSINQYISKSSSVGNRVLVIISPPAAPSDSTHQSINQNNQSINQNINQSIH
jgi:hypothetical protein